MRKAFKHIALLIVLTTIFILSASVQETKSQEEIPLLAVVKYADKKEVRVGEAVTVYIEIINLSNTTAYNITLEDPYPDWGFEILEQGGTEWDRLDPNETVVTFFKLKIKNYVTGYYSLGKAKVIYYDSEGNKYIAYSGEVWIKVIYYGVNPVDVEKIWRNTAIWVGLLILSVISPLLFLEYRFYRSYKREMKEKK